MVPKTVESLAISGRRLWNMNKQTQCERVSVYSVYNDGGTILHLEESPI